MILSLETVDLRWRGRVEVDSFTSTKVFLGEKGGCPCDSFWDRIRRNSFMFVC